MAIIWYPPHFAIQSDFQLSDFHSKSILCHHFANWHSCTTDVCWQRLFGTYKWLFSQYFLLCMPLFPVPTQSWIMKTAAPACGEILNYCSPGHLLKQWWWIGDNMHTWALIKKILITLLIWGFVNLCSMSEMVCAYLLVKLRLFLNAWCTPVWQPCSTAMFESSPWLG